MTTLVITDGVHGAADRVQVAQATLRESQTGSLTPSLWSVAVASALADSTRVREARAAALADSLALLEAGVRSGVEELLAADRALAAGLL